MKNQRFKRLLCLTLSVSLILGEPTVALAAEDAEAPQEITKVEESVRGTTAEEGDYRYEELDDGTVKITRYSKTQEGDSEIEIPSTIAGKSVTQIGDEAFYNITYLEKITIPEGVTHIGNQVFCSCTSLEEVNIPESTIQIGDKAFAYTAIRSIRIPAKVENIGNGVFYDTYLLESIEVDESNKKYVSQEDVLYNSEKKELLCYPQGKAGDRFIIPNDIISIADYAFVGCSYLKTIDIPNGVTSIGDRAFKSGSIEYITIPSSVTSIGEGAFFYCRTKNIEVDEKNTAYASQDGVLYNKEKTEIICCPQQKKGEFIVPNSVTSVGSWAFADCLYLTNILLPAHMTKIGAGAFYSCDGITSITIPEGVTEIGKEAFCGCEKLGSINLPSNVTRIEDRTFYSCKELQKVKMLGDVVYIGWESFAYCEKLSDIRIPESMEEISWYAFCGCNNLININIPENVKEIGSYVFKAFNRVARLTLWVTPDSYAEQYAKNCRIDYKYPSDCIHDYEGENIKAPTCISDGEVIYTCKICRESYTGTIPALAHTIVTDKAIPATCTTEGKTEGSHCSVCNTVITAQQTVPVTAHKYTTAVTKATTESDGSITKKCTVCGAVESTTAIPHPQTIELSKATYTYNGKTQKPSVTVRDSQGKALAEGTDYTVSSSGNCKDVGKYTVTINFTGKYSGSIEKSFTLTPKSTSLAKVKAAKKGFTAKWKKQSSQTTGYQIQYSTSSKFTKKVTKAITISKNKITSKSISKLKAKKKYYVRVRTYKTVKIDGKNTKIYSDWSKVKSVTTKK